MKKQLLYFSMVGMLLTMNACDDDGKTEFLDDYSTIMYFTNSGIQNVECLKVGEPTTYNIAVYKAGSDLSATSDATVTLMNEAELQEYNLANDTHYKMLPADCYQSTQKKDFQFESSELVHTFPVTFDSDKIDALDKNSEYALPFSLSSTQTVNEEKKVLLLHPEVTTPTISFQNVDFEQVTVTERDPAKVVLERIITVPFQNNWEFDCEIGIDETAVGQYNEENGRDYSLLPETAYTYDKIVTFKPGINSMTIKVTIDRSELDNGNYLLPLKLKKCTHPRFEIQAEKSLLLIGYCYALPNIPLNLSMLTANATVEGDGTGLTGLFDGVGDGKHYHSNYSGSVIDPIYGHYIQIHFKESIQTLLFEYWTRSNTNNGTPLRIELFTSNDGIQWHKLTVIEKGLPTTQSTKYQSGFFKADEPFTYLRWCVTKGPNGEMAKQGDKGYFNLDDLIIYGQ